MSLRTCLLIACSPLFLATLSDAQEPAANPKKSTLWVIPHTHWEGAVFKTREEYLDVGLANIVKAIKLLKEQPGYRFTLDQVAYVRPFLERYPALEADFRRFMTEGRLQVVGALDVMPDDNMPGGETFIRQMQYGKGYYRDKLGIDVTSGWLIDTFGHHAQLPQLLAKAGFKTFWFVRGVPRQDFPSEFFWEGIDGTRISSIYLPHSYAIMYGSPNDKAGFKAFAQGRYNMLTPNSLGPDRVGLSGPDVVEPEEQLAPRVEEFNRDPEAPFAMRMAVPADFEAAIAKRTDRPVFKGELNPIFQGIYSSRIELKAWMRVMEERLLTAEKLSAMPAAPADRAGLWAAWEPVLFNQTHDLASGVMTDHVYDDTVRSYEYSLRRAEGLIDTGWNALTSKIDTSGPGAPAVVFNSLGWQRSDIALVDVGFVAGGVKEAAVIDSDGQKVPSQLVDSTRYADNGLKTARIAFIARDVPALGFRVFHVVPRPPGESESERPTAIVDLPNSEVRLENKHHRLTLNRLTGAMTSLVLKKGDWEALSGRGNVVARQQDKGDLWELYKGLDGGSRVAMTTHQSVPKRGVDAFSDEGKGEPGTLVNGPVFSELKIARPFGSGRFATSVRFYSGLRRIEVTTRLVNQEKYVRYQALFPTTISGGKGTHEIPFGAIDRPPMIEFPAQNWVDFSDGRHGLAVLNFGLPGNLVSDGTMMVSLLRAHTLGAYGFGGGYEPGMSSDSGFQLGQERTMRYALLPHAGDWRDAGLFRDGLEFNHPLICRAVLSHAGELPKRWGLIDVSNPNIVISSMSPSRDGDVALRMYEASGRQAPAVAIRFHSKVRAAREANLIDDPGAELKVDGNSVRIDFQPFEIKTFRISGFEKLIRD